MSVGRSFFIYFMFGGHVLLSVSCDFKAKNIFTRGHKICMKDVSMVYCFLNRLVIVLQTTLGGLLHHPDHTFIFLSENSEVLLHLNVHLTFQNCLQRIHGSSGWCGCLELQYLPLKINTNRLKNVEGGRAETKILVDFPSYILFIQA